MKEIKLTKGMIALVDDEDYEQLNKWKWHVSQVSKKYWYAMRTEWIGKKHVYMHRVIMGSPENMLVDHANGNTLDNRRCNLRLATKQQNQQHQAAQKTSRHGKRTSIYKGVSWFKTGNKWRAVINVNQKQKHLGVFESEVEAAEAYNKAALELFGEFAWLNDLT